MAAKWTPDQQKAIDAREGTLLVSAAAGSGKTAVLVERVIQRLTDAEKTCGVDDLLIVTFTKAAAAQMRDRISAAISKRLAETPDNMHLQKQQLMLPLAKICTIDSFCNELVRENFHQLGISPDYKIPDESEVALLRREALSTVSEALYAEDSAEFSQLVELLFKGRDDSVLTDAISRLYTLACAYPEPDEWLAKLVNQYACDLPVGKTEWGKSVIKYARSAVNACIDLSKNVLTLIEDETDLYNSYSATFESDISMYKNLLAVIDGGTWNEIHTAVRDVKFCRIGSLPRGYESELKSLAQSIRDEKCKKIIKGLPDDFCATEEEFKDDMHYIRPIVSKLISAVYMYEKEFSRLKTERNSPDFSDILHLAVRLLLAHTDDGLKKTALAEELSGQFEEILVDEFQDINEVQNLLFTAVSRERGNLFMVGDVKQSIYRFRQAMPEIFLNIRDGLPLYDGSYPARINLGMNFRSRRGVTQAVNFIFKQLMTPQVGDLYYTNEEKLIAGADYPEHDIPDAELHLLTEDEGKQTQAQYVAALIRKMIDDGTQVRDGDTTRRARYGDFCILMRSVKGAGTLFNEALQEQGVPSYFDVSEGLFDTAEIKFMLSLLRVLDNPVQDVPLIAVMLSPVFGFTPDDLAKMRIPDRKIPLYTCLVNYAKTDEKSAGFLKRTESLRRLASTLSSDELIRRLLDDTGYLAIVSAMPGGNERRANLRLLGDYAVRYASYGHIGLTGFIAFIDKVAQSSNKFSVANQISEHANVVRIMNMHKSKGLEFPICIIANCDKAFNDMEQNETLIVHPRAGIGLSRLNTDTRVKFDTVAHRATRLAVSRDSRSEELRILYVAMTRAKERLITVMSLKNPQGTLLKLAANIMSDEIIEPFFTAKCKSFSDWLLMTALRHPDAHILRNVAGANFIKCIPSDLKMKFVCPDLEAAEVSEEEAAGGTEPSAELTAEINRRLSYVYPYESLNRVVAKQSASGMVHDGFNENFFASSAPSFMSTDGLTPAQKGTAFHLFMQHCDYAKAIESVPSEIERLVSSGKLSAQEGESLNAENLRKFFDGELARRIINSSEIFRERRFTVNMPAGMLYDLPEITADENILIQGMVDCAFVEDGELVIVDYKTDRVSDLSELVERYAEQLDIYKYAMQKCTGLKVRETVLYSFTLGTTETVFHSG